MSLSRNKLKKKMERKIESQMYCALPRVMELVKSSEYFFFNFLCHTLCLWKWESWRKEGSRRVEKIMMIVELKTKSTCQILA